MMVFLLAGWAGASTPINGCGAITSPGTYVLTKNIIDSSATYCIEIASSDVVLDGNGFKIDGVAGTLTYGVYTYASNVTVRNLNVTDWYYGIYYYKARNGTIHGNNVSNNSYHGIYLWGSSNNTLIGNNVRSNNYYGIYLQSSSNNLIYDNIFNNTDNYASFSSSNIWNTTRSPGTSIVGGGFIGGNFWGNPGGSDFSQTCRDIDRDGICDSPYVLDASNTDYLPLSNNYAVQPSVVIYTDKTGYRAGDKMYVGLNVSNPGNATKVGMYIWVDLPDGGKKDVKSYPSITLPAGLDWKKYPWMTVTLSGIPPGDYAWHAILKNTTTGNIVSESISPWTFVSAASVSPGKFEAMDGAGAPVDADLLKEFE